MKKHPRGEGPELVIREAQKVLQIEAEAIQFLRQKIGESFVRAVDLLHGCRGKVIVIGIGKSGIVAQKMASTFSCTGTPAFFLHPAEGIHGDIGMMSRAMLPWRSPIAEKPRKSLRFSPSSRGWEYRLSS